MHKNVQHTHAWVNWAEGSCKSVKSDSGIP